MLWGGFSLLWTIEKHPNILRFVRWGKKFKLCKYFCWALYSVLYITHIYCTYLPIIFILSQWHLKSNRSWFSWDGGDVLSSPELLQLQTASSSAAQTGQRSETEKEKTKLLDLTRNLLQHDIFPSDAPLICLLVGKLVKDLCKYLQYGLSAVTSCFHA